MVSPGAQYPELAGRQDFQNTINGSPANLYRQLEEVEGHLFVHRSAVLRNYFHTQGQLAKTIQKHNSGLASFQLKKQKLFEVLMKDIDETLLHLREALRSVNQSRRKRENIKVLAKAYAFNEELAQIIHYEDTLKSATEGQKSKEGLEAIFEKYQIDDNDLQDLMIKSDPLLNGITLTESTFIKKSDIPHFSTEGEEEELSIPCEPIPLSCEPLSIPCEPLPIPCEPVS